MITRKVLLRGGGVGSGAKGGLLLSLPALLRFALLCTREVRDHLANMMEMMAKTI